MATTSTNYGTAQSLVSTTANLNIVQTSAVLNASFGTAIEIRLESAGVPIDAPAGGIAVTLTAATSTVLEILERCLRDESRAELRRLVQQGAVSLNGEPLGDASASVTVRSGDGLKVGKRRWFRVSLAER